MAERWQQWMPHDIDAWQGSANVQALSDLAYRAVHNLLQDMWKQADCALPVDDRELAKRSRIALRWNECKDEVLEYFTDRTESGRLTHRVLLRKWDEARAKYESNKEARSEAGKMGAAKRWHSKPIANAIESHSKPMAKNGNNTGTVQEQKQEQVQKQKPSRDKREPDPRHGEFKEAFVRYFAHKNNGLEAPWDEQEGAQLARFLRKNPHFTTEKWKTLLNHRARSPVPHGENLSAWVGRALTWANAPAGKTGGFNGKPTINDSLSAKQAVLDARRARRMADELDSGGGIPEAGFAALGTGSERHAAGLVLEGAMGDRQS